MFNRSTLTEMSHSSTMMSHSCTSTPWKRQNSSVSSQLRMESSGYSQTGEKMSTHLCHDSSVCVFARFAYIITADGKAGTYAEKRLALVINFECDCLGKFTVVCQQCQFMHGPISTQKDMKIL